MIRYRYVFSLLFVGLLSVVAAQTAPNFTVTDSWGNPHKLYEDYLDQGKTVLIEIFKAAYPPCNQIAPYLETLYQEWNAGHGNVQFIELSNLTTDTDKKVNIYKGSNGTSYPAAGSQGGSVDATEALKSGVFGSYSVTPTFIVIAPNRTIQWDVKGPDIPSTIAAIDAALIATGAEKMTTAFTEPELDLPLKFLSNIVDQKIVLDYFGEATTLDASIINLLGQVNNKAKLQVHPGGKFYIGVSYLAQGLWVLQLQDQTTNIMASYLFLKR